MSDTGPGWEHVESRAYWGANPKWGKVHKIHIKFKRKPNVSSGNGIAAGLLNGLGGVVCAMSAMFVADSLFPVKEGESTFGRDFLIGWGVLEGLDAMDRNRELEEKVRRLEDRDDD